MFVDLHFAAGKKGRLLVPFWHSLSVSPARYKPQGSLSFVSSRLSWSISSFTFGSRTVAISRTSRFIRKYRRADGSGASAKHRLLTLPINHGLPRRQANGRTAESAKAAEYTAPKNPEPLSLPLC